MGRITKYEPSDKSMFPYKLKDEELSTELDSIHKLGQLEDIMEKYDINSVEELERVILNDATGEQAFESYVECYVKLYKDIEEKLGIDLITYFKIKNAKSVHVKESDGNINEMLVRPSKDSIDVCYKSFAGIPECDKALYFKDYGKTWALTREELEKDSKEEKLLKNVLYGEKSKEIYLKCPYCESKNVRSMFASTFSGKCLVHYECLECHKEFELEP